MINSQIALTVADNYKTRGNSVKLIKHHSAITRYYFLLCGQRLEFFIDWRSLSMHLQSQF